jgi:hypothetical protein
MRTQGKSYFLKKRAPLAAKEKLLKKFLFGISSKRFKGRR